MKLNTFSAKNYYSNLLLYFFTLLLPFMAFSCHPYVPFLGSTDLIIKDVDSDTILCSYPVREGSLVVFSFIHSLYHGKQHEKYSIVNQKLMLMETFFSSYDMATYYNEDPPEGIQTIQSGYVVRSNKEIKNITFKLGTTVPHSLYINEMEIDLYKLSAPGKTLQIFIGKLISHNPH